VVQGVSLPLMTIADQKDHASKHQMIRWLHDIEEGIGDLARAMISRVIGQDVANLQGERFWVCS
jgi:hypothetical protein